MAKETLIGVRADQQMKEALQQIAEADGRTLSNLIQKILNDYLAHNNPGGVASTPSSQ